MIVAEWQQEVISGRLEDRQDVVTEDRLSVGFPKIIDKDALRELNHVLILK